MQQLNSHEQKWFDLIQEARSSGLSDKAWCLQNKIAPSTFYYNISKLRHKAAEIPESVYSMTPEVHEVVRLEILEEENLPAPACQEESVVSCSREVQSANTPTGESGFSARVCFGPASAEFSNSACEQLVFSVISALRKPC